MRLYYESFQKATISFKITLKAVHLYRFLSNLDINGKSTSSTVLGQLFNWFYYPIFHRVLYQKRHLYMIN